ncbi:MAG: hypothetical protein AAFV85_28105, partial [Cyanobacteria bacterium J06634_6]
MRLGCRGEQHSAAEAHILPPPKWTSFCIYAQDFQLEPPFEIDIARKLILFWDGASAFDQILIPVIDGHRAGSIAISKESETVAFINFVL